MKEKITRLKFKSPKEVITENYRIVWNTNEDDETLDIAIHRQGEDTTRKFSYSINNGPKHNFSTKDEDIIRSEKGEQREVIYQISVPFSEIEIKDNVVVIYDNANNVLSPIARIEFFAETEDNFKNIRLDRPGIEPTNDESFWDALIARIKDQRLKFSEYEKFIDTILCTKSVDPHYSNGLRTAAKIRSPFIKSEEYNLIKFATDFYMAARLGLDTRQLQSYTHSTGGRLPYYDVIIDRIKDDISLSNLLKDSVVNNNDCVANETERIFFPIMIELIWNYWMEQGMLVQTMNVINLRFQNIKGDFYADRLQRFDADPLRPLSHILWGYIQDEQHRLSIPRRLNEYDHVYGLTLTGRAVPRIRPVDTRVKFLEAFHSLLTQCTIYFKESDDTTRIADAFPILNSLKEVHLLLAEGNHNAYGNLTWTARQEMMMQQYILSRPEMREFLGGRVMVPYPETWMDRVDTMRNLQGWGGTGIVHYYELAIHGELLLLSIRYGNWSDVNLDRNNAANWAQKFRNSVQRYIHAYRSVTGIDMSVDQIVQLPGNFAAQPAYLIQQRLLEERSRTRRA